MNLYVFTLRAEDGREFEYQAVDCSTLAEAEDLADERARQTGAALIRVTKSYVGEPVEAARSEHEPTEWQKPSIRPTWKRIQRGWYEADGRIYVTRTRDGWAYGLIVNGEHWAYGLIVNGEHDQHDESTRPLQRVKMLAEELLAGVI